MARRYFGGNFENDGLGDGLDDGIDGEDSGLADDNNAKKAVPIDEGDNKRISEEDETDSDEGETSENYSEKKLLDYSYDEVMDILHHGPEGKSQVEALIADAMESIEAENWGMSQEKYQIYKSICESNKVQDEDKDQDYEDDLDEDSHHEILIENLKFDKEEIAESKPLEDFPEELIEDTSFESEVKEDVDDNHQEVLLEEDSYELTVDEALDKDYDEMLEDDTNDIVIEDVSNESQEELTDDKMVDVNDDTEPKDYDVVLIDEDSIDSISDEKLEEVIIDQEEGHGNIKDVSSNNKDEIISETEESIQIKDDSFVEYKKETDSNEGNDKVKENRDEELQDIQKEKNEAREVNFAEIDLNGSSVNIASGDKQPEWMSIHDVNSNIEKAGFDTSLLKKAFGDVLSEKSLTETEGEKLSILANTLNKSGLKNEANAVSHFCNSNEKALKTQNNDEYNGVRIDTFSDIRKEATNLLNDANMQDEKFKTKFKVYHTLFAFTDKIKEAGRNEALDNISNENSYYIKELKNVREKIRSERDLIDNKLKRLYTNGFNETNSKEFNDLWDKRGQLRSLSDQLDYSIIKLDANNRDISEVINIEYHNEGTKELDKTEIDKYVDCLNDVLQNEIYDLRNGIQEDVSKIIDLYRLRERIYDDVLPSLDASLRDCQTKITMAECSQKAYLEKNNCSHEEAMTHSDGQYARNEAYIDSLKKEANKTASKLVEVVEKSSALHDQILVKDGKLRVIENRNGTVTIENYVKKGEEISSSHKGRFHNSKCSLQKNVLKEKRTIVMGINSNTVYAKSYKLERGGFAFEKIDTIGGSHTFFKNILEGVVGNGNLLIGYNRGMDGTLPTFSAKAAISAFDLKNTSSIALSDKEYKLFSAETSLLKASAELETDEYGFISVKGEGHLVGAEAGAYIGDIRIAKIGSGLGKVTFDTSSISREFSSSYDMKKTNLGIGNNLSIVELKSVDGAVSSKSILNRDVMLEDGMNIVKDVDALKDVAYGKLGTDLTQKGKVKIDVDSKKREADIKKDVTNKNEVVVADTSGSPIDNSGDSNEASEAVVSPHEGPYSSDFRGSSFNMTEYEK